MDIDFVVTWVDMDDPEWKKSFAKAKGTIDNSQNQFSEARFRDYGFLKYWFRGVEGPPPAGCPTPPLRPGTADRSGTPDA